MDKEIVILIKDKLEKFFDKEINVIGTNQPFEESCTSIEYWEGELATCEYLKDKVLKILTDLENK